MNELVRVSRRILASLPSAPRHTRNALKAGLLFESPGRFISRYITGRPLNGHVVRLRDGFEIETSQSDRDCATIMVVLVREDYATIPRGGLIVDVGANIGAFMLYAIRSSARRVICFEPSRDAFQVLRRNVERNRLNQSVVVRQLAVVGQGSGPVWFPTASCPSNHIFDTTSGDAVPEHHEKVSTTSLAEIVDTHGDVDLLKLDCEGAEYEIVSSTPACVWKRIREVRIEYHKGRALTLVAPLQECGFRLTRHVPDPLWPDDMGMLHFEQA